MSGTRKSAPAGDDLVTRQQLAERLKCHPRTLAKWIEEGLPVARRGRGGRASLYNETAVRAWRQARDESAQQQPPDLLVARARKELAQAIEAEQRVAIRAGKLIAIEDVDRTWSAQVAAVRAQLLALPTALADRLHRVATLEGAAGVEAVLLEAVHAALRELASKPAALTKRPRRVKKKGASRRRTKKRSS